MANPAANRSRIVSPHQRQVLRTRARRMRHEPTHSEWVLWQVLRRKQLGVRFRRQVVLQGYITDFYAASAAIVIEVDGAYHPQRTHADSRRDRHLEAAGYRVLHVSAEAVLTDLPAVLREIRATL